MNPQETMALLFLAKQLYPRDKGLAVEGPALASMAEAWACLLQDVPFDLGKGALIAHCARNPYPPTISELRAGARKLTEKDRLTGAEAWQIAYSAMRRYGCVSQRFSDGTTPMDRARKMCPPEVWRVMELLGYKAMCMSETPDLLRAQFIRVWEQQQQREEERAALRLGAAALGGTPGVPSLPGGEGDNSADAPAPRGLSPTDSASAPRKALSPTPERQKEAPVERTVARLACRLSLEP